ncbi:MAG: class I adenylate-forming enzyme family protein [Polyangiaceae bacterium]
MSSKLVQEAKRAVGVQVDRAATLARVGLKTGLATTVRPAGIAVMAAPLLRGKSSPSVLMRFHAKNLPNKLALRGSHRSYTFAELDAEIDRLVAELRARGATKGTSAVLAMRNRPEFIVLQLAMGRLGGAAVSVSWRSTPDELTYLLDHSGARFAFFDADLSDRFESAREKLRAQHQQRGSGVLFDGFTMGGSDARFDRYDDLVAKAPRSVSRASEHDASDEAAVVIYTSGTTGKPKGAVRKFPRDAITQGMRFIEQTPLRTEDIHLAVCPLYHSTAFGFASLSLSLGSTIVVLDEFKPEAFLDAIDRYQVTTTAVVPTMLHRVLELGTPALRSRDLRSLRSIFAGGAPLPGPLATRTLDMLGPVLFNFYGATETGLVTLANPQDLAAEPTTIGKAVPGNEIRLLDDNGREVKPGEVGELYVRNPLLVEGYHRDDKATDDSMREGFFTVGDLARVDSRGRYFIEGRKRDMIISGGVNVYPAEVEGVLDTHPDISEAAVVGVADQEWGEKVKAFVVLKTNAEPNPEGIRAYCRERLSGPKVPREIVFLDALPRNPTGKVLKRELR